MYMRFVTPLIHPHSRVETGFFRASTHIYSRGVEPWLVSEYREQMDWFNANLPIPRRLAHHFKRRDSLFGVC